MTGIARNSVDSMKQDIVSRMVNEEMRQPCLLNNGGRRFLDGGRVLWGTNRKTVRRDWSLTGIEWGTHLVHMPSSIPFHDQAAPLLDLDSQSQDQKKRIWFVTGRYNGDKQEVQE